MILEAVIFASSSCVSYIPPLNNKASEQGLGLVTCQRGKESEEHMNMTVGQVRV